MFVGGVVAQLMPVVELDPAALRCPYPYFDAVREEQPVVFVPAIECWLVTRYADIVQIARDPQTFSSIMPTGPVLARQQREAVEGLLADEPELAARLGRMRGGTRVLLSADPPDHVRQRKLVNRAFTPPKVKDLEPRIRAVAERARRGVRRPGPRRARRRVRRAPAADDHRRGARRRRRRAAAVQALVRRLRRPHRQPRHRPRPAARRPALAVRVLRVLRAPRRRASRRAPART